MNKSRDKKNALAFANRVRRILGKKPVSVLKRGRPNMEDRCPLANTIGGVTVDGNQVEYRSNDLTIRVECPDTIARFVDDFDCGEYPELEVK